MIPELAIQEWQEHAPWPGVEQVEQDLLICRALVAIYSDPFLAANLAFRGGTALHKLFLNPQPRYSEDIDLVQVYAVPIKETIMHLQKALAFMGNAYIKQKRHNNTLLYRLESETEPRMPIRIKIEINCKEHFSVFPMITVPFKVENKWFSGECKILTYQLEELIGTKLRALYQRRKGRDLFDLFKALSTGEINDDKILESYFKYMEFVVDHIPTYKEFCLNMEEKMQDDEFLGDTVGLLRKEASYNPQESYELVRARLLDRMKKND